MIARIAQAIKKYGSAIFAEVIALISGDMMDPKLGAVIIAAWGLVMAVAKFMAPDADKILAVKEAKADAKKN